VVLGMGYGVRGGKYLANGNRRPAFAKALAFGRRSRPAADEDGWQNGRQATVIS